MSPIYTTIYIRNLIPISYVLPLSKYRLLISKTYNFYSEKQSLLYLNVK